MTTTDIAVTTNDHLGSKTTRIKASKESKSKQTSFAFEVVKPAVSNPNLAIGKSAEPCRANYPGLYTAGKMVQGKVPSLILSTLDNLENQWGKLNFSKVVDICEAADAQNLDDRQYRLTKTSRVALEYR